MIPRFEAQDREFNRTIDVSFDGTGFEFYGEDEQDVVWVNLSTADSERFLTWIRANFNFGLLGQVDTTPEPV